MGKSQPFCNYQCNVQFRKGSSVDTKTNGESLLRVKIFTNITPQITDKT